MNVAHAVGWAASCAIIAGIGAVLESQPRVEPQPYYAIDGDTIAVGGWSSHRAHIRLTDIDAPEFPGHCRPGRHCVEGDPYAAKRALQTFLDQGMLLCHDKTTDVYHRRIADCSIETRSGSFNLSQAMFSTGLVGLYEQRN